MKVGNILLINYQSLTNKSYGLRFKGDHQYRVAGIYSIGKEIRTDTSYYWNGQARSENDIFVLQYTLKGAGKIKFEQQTYDLNPGDAFFIHIPSNHIYYLPEESEEWEFIYITLLGNEVFQCYEKITKAVGNIFQLDVYSPPIQSIMSSLDKISNEQINDVYKASACAYDFLMSLYADVFQVNRKNTIPSAIKNATAFINENYAAPVSLDDIVAASGLSKYHFTRLFHESMNATPIQYLTKIRVNKAIQLLKNEQLTVEAIALKVGFSNGNYFTKVFRSYLGVSPSVYRNNKTFSQVDYLISD
ncbi:helix-turn-helix transcriptional regulator [Virgibacillus sp. NKC19-3]|uniref:AraC family transcriptional regulator n=1 Tax=Virgibacillus saliphilus TaxID=2831674 RepID=UPI001C9B461A|nr:AraC family transcriptional regulator [Virgibacillus sp. NKC19-3]MBY7142882.1 helix-turn-helix transcriptional regulator [Virgibacillus sp. NKC19-3]